MPLTPPSVARASDAPLLSIDRGGRYPYTKNVQHDRNRKRQQCPENDGGPGQVAPIVKLRFNFVV